MLLLLLHHQLLLQLLCLLQQGQHTSRTTGSTSRTWPRHQAQLLLLLQLLQKLPPVQESLHLLVYLFCRGTTICCLIQLQSLP
jgi:hypothetical protein